MKVIAFVGASGTGKSYRATWVAKENGATHIIDDGLLISGNRVIAGLSAKRESTKIASVRRALFMHKEHREAVKKAIKEQNPEKLLLIATSVAMAENIVKALALPDLEEIIEIESVAKPDEIKTALSVRIEQGKHVIPVPTFEIKRDFSGYLIDPLKIFRRGENRFAEKSIIRPTFSYLGSYKISDTVITAICEHEALKITGVARVNRASADSSAHGVLIYLEITMEYGVKIMPCAKKVWRAVRESIEKYTAINVQKLDLVVKTLQIKPVL